MKFPIQRFFFLGSALASISLETFIQAETTVPSVSPSSGETPMPSPFPPTGSPTGARSPEETAKPTKIPTKRPTKIPTAGPTLEPTAKPTTKPTAKPTTKPSKEPTDRPSAAPTSNPTDSPISNPTESPSSQPTGNPTDFQSAGPSMPPTIEPTFASSQDLTALPTSEPTSEGTLSPEAQPSNFPSSSPSTSPAKHDIPKKTDANTTIHFESPFQNFYSGLTSAPTSDSLAPTSQPTEEPSVEPTTAPISTPSAEPSASHSQLSTERPSSQPSQPPTSSNIEASTNPPSLVVVSDSSSKPTKAPVSKVTGPKPSSTPSLAPSAEPTSTPLSTAADESEGVEITTAPTESRETSPPFSGTRTDSPEEHEALVSLRLEDIPELMDPASGILLATSITHFLSDEISQMDGVPVFFLRTEIYTQNPLADSKNRDVVLVEAGVHGITVGGTVTDKVFTAKVEQALNEKKGDLENHVRGALESFAGRLTGGNTGDKTLNSVVGGNSTSNTVLLVAIIASVMIGMLILSVVCIAFARRETADHHDIILKHTGTGLTAPRHSLSHSSTRDLSKSMSIKNSKSLPRPYDAESQSGSKGSRRSRSIPIEQAPHSQHSVGSQAKSLPSTTLSQNRNLPPRPPITTSASYKSRSGLSVLAMSSSESVSPSSTADMFGYQSQCGDNIELVGIEDDEGTWVGTKVAAITGGKEIQKAEMLCKHKETINRQLRSSTATDNTVIGSTTVLNDLVLTETTSKHHNAMRAHTPTTPSRGGLLTMNLWKKNKIETPKGYPSEAGSSVQEDEPKKEGYVPRTRSSESAADKKQDNFKNRSGEPRVSSKPIISGGQQTRSSMSHLMDAYSFSTAGSRSIESRSTQSSADKHSARKGSPGQYDAKPMKRRQSSGISENNYERSRTRSSQQSRMSSGSSALSASLASGYSSDSCDSESSYSQSSQEVPDESFLLRLKDTVSTAAFSRATNDQKPEASGPYARKLSMSASSGQGQRSSNPVAAMLGFSSP